MVKARVINSDFRGQIKAILRNSSSHEFTVKKKQRICQGLLVQVFKADFIQLKDENDWQDDSYIVFGSTGL